MLIRLKKFKEWYLAQFRTTAGIIKLTHINIVLIVIFTAINIILLVLKN